MTHSLKALPSIEEDVSPLFDAPNHTGTPERRLLLAILERAILDYVGNDPKEIAEAKAWLFDDEDDLQPSFSFSWLCQELDLNEQLVARKIRAMPRRGEKRIPPWYFQKQA